MATISQDTDIFCPACHAQGTIEGIHSDFPLFAHQDFSPLPVRNDLAVCTNCAVIHRRQVDADVVGSMFTGTSYAQSMQTEQSRHVAGFNQPTTRSALQAILIAERLTGTHPVVLDVGCFDGRLLYELQQHRPQAELHGIDINPHLREHFNNRSGISFSTAPIESFATACDAICLSHSIMYFREPKTLLMHISRLLRPGGMMFVCTPDASENPCTLLYGDQATYYTADGMQRMLQMSGFDSEIISDSWFPRELVVCATVSPQPRRPPGANNPVPAVQALCNRLKCLKDTMEDTFLSWRDTMLGILGTTINAAYCKAILGDTVLFFADEDTGKIGTRFADCDVFDPTTVPASATVLVPYFEESERIIRRLQSRCRCRLLGV